MAFKGEKDQEDKESEFAKNLPSMIQKRGMDEEW